MIEDSLTLSARVFGLLNFVNFIWLVAVAGALCTVGPCVVYLFGDVMKRLARAVFDHAVLPLHRAGAFEVAAYVAAALLTAQAYRYPGSLADAAAMVGLSGGGALLPCWAYSTLLFAPVRATSSRAGSGGGGEDGRRWRSGGGGGGGGVAAVVVEVHVEGAAVAVVVVWRSDCLDWARAHLTASAQATGGSRSRFASLSSWLVAAALTPLAMGLQSQIVGFFAIT